MSDIRFLQADPANKGAVFQIASTLFGPLEGGMIKRSAYLTNMIRHAAQGEEASISAAPATIWRKYFMPQHKYLLYHLRHKLPENPKGKVNFDQAIKYRYDPTDINKVGVGIHQNVFVTSGTGSTGEKGNQERLSLTEDQRITQIFTSAYNTLYARKKGQLKQVTSLSKMLLNGSYEGTLKAAYYVNQPRVFLTLMGGGSFRNDIDWIGHAIKRNTDFIKKSGLQVTLIYRPDKDRPYQPVRTAPGDIKFLRNMIKMADAINGTKFQYDRDLNKLIEQYANKAYSRQDYSNEAQQINRILGNPSYVGTSITPTYTPTPTKRRTAPRPSQKPFGSFTYLSQSRKRDTIGWLYINRFGDSVLINLGRNTTPTIDAKGNTNFIYINPDTVHTKAPKGLYYWKSQGSPKLGVHKNLTLMKHQPNMRSWKYRPGTQNKFFDPHNNPWNTGRITSPHPWK